CPMCSIDWSSTCVRVWRGFRNDPPRSVASGRRSCPRTERADRRHDAGHKCGRRSRTWGWEDGTARSTGGLSAAHRTLPLPRRILAVSFKTDAARNLRERVRRRSGAQLAARFDSFTFHAFAKHLIDNFRATLTGYNALNPDYRVDPATQIQGEQITFN